MDQIHASTRTAVPELGPTWQDGAARSHPVLAPGYSLALAGYIAAAFLYKQNSIADICGIAVSYCYGTGKGSECVQVHMVVRATVIEAVEQCTAIQPPDIPSCCKIFLSSILA